MNETEVIAQAFGQLTEVLTQRTTAVQVFFRDDDGGWANARLARLCECFQQEAVALDIAVIPAALDTESVELITTLLSAAHMPVHIHQHGFAHVNHQTEGRACEFGTERSAARQYEDIDAGMRRLRELLGDHPEPVFTPPWNRCTNDTVVALHSLGFACLSRIDGSDALARQVPELPVSVDWLKKRKGVRLDAAAIIKNTSRAFASGADVVGIMLHHEHMDLSNRSTLLELIRILKQSPQVSFASMLEIATGRPNQEQAL